MTEKLFHKDAYMKEAHAVVARVDGNRVFLDRTIFFAFSGGQASDRGDISGKPVVDVVEENGDIAHVVDGKFEPGERVVLKLDWERRYRLMRLHTAAHLVYYLVIERIGKQNIIGSNVAPKKARVDFEYGESLKPLMSELEKKANEMIAQGAEVRTYDDVKPERRLWECKEWKMPCGGTHVRDLREIGLIKLKRENIGKGKERVEITLG